MFGGEGWMAFIVNPLCFVCDHFISDEQMKGEREKTRVPRVF